MLLLKNEYLDFSKYIDISIYLHITIIVHLGSQIKKIIMSEFLAMLRYCNFGAILIVHFIRYAIIQYEDREL